MAAPYLPSRTLSPLTEKLWSVYNEYQVFLYLQDLTVMPDHSQVYMYCYVH